MVHKWFICFVGRIEILCVERGGCSFEIGIWWGDALEKLNTRWRKDDESKNYEKLFRFKKREYFCAVRTQINKKTRKYNNPVKNIFSKTFFLTFFFWTSNIRFVDVLHNTSYSQRIGDVLYWSWPGIDQSIVNRQKNIVLVKNIYIIILLKTFSQKLFFELFFLNI